MEDRQWEKVASRTLVHAIVFLVGSGPWISIPSSARTVALLSHRRGIVTEIKIPARISGASFDGEFKIRKISATGEEKISSLVWSLLSFVLQNLIPMTTKKCLNVSELKSLWKIFSSLVVIKWEEPLAVRRLECLLENFPHFPNQNIRQIWKSPWP
jgi:hypothetical protein